MKRKAAPLAEVELLPAPQGCAAPRPPSSGPGGAASFVIQLPEGATVTVPAGFDFDEALALLTLVREALR